MRLERAGCGELASAEFASEVAIFLVLQQNVRVLELLLAVEAEWLQHVDTTLFSTHFFLKLIIIPPGTSL